MSKKYIWLNQFFILFALCLLTSILCAQPLYNPEDTIPTNIYAGSGTVSISDAHYRIGEESLKWDFNGADTLTFEETYSSGLYTWGLNHFSMWVYNETPINDSIHVEYINDAGEIPFRFYFIANFTGWRKLLRSYRFDMLKSGAAWNVTKMLVRTPETVSGSLFFDDIRYVTNTASRLSDRQMPDLVALANHPYGSGDFYLTADNTVPDIPATTPTASEMSDMTIVCDRMKNFYTAGNPSAADLAAADAFYNSLNIVETGDQIKGITITTPNVYDIHVYHYARHYRNSGSMDSYNKLRNMLRLMLDSGVAAGSSVFFAGGSAGYGARYFFQGLSIMGGEFEPELNAEIWEWLKWAGPTGTWWYQTEAEWKGTFNTDNIHVLYAYYYSVMTYAPNDEEKLRYLKGFQRYLERFCSPQPGRTDGPKIDGPGFHHGSHHTPYMYAYNTLTFMLSQLNGTQFQINKESYDFFRDCAIQLLVQEKDFYNANSLCGRGPFLAFLPMQQGAYKNLAAIGGVHYDGTADPTAAQHYHRRFGASDPTYAAYGVGEPLNGFFQFNSSPMGIYRADDWTVTMRAFTTQYWGSEIYSNSNRYGRYQSHGTIEVIYAGGGLTSGINAEGYDWNRPSGTTTIRLPLADLQAQGGRLDVYNNGTNFAGAVRFKPVTNSLLDIQGETGVMAFDMRSQRNNTFTFRVSRFSFDGMIVALGSKISNNETVNPTSTNLFQNYLNDSADPITVNGTAVSGFPNNQTLPAGENWLLDAYGTGYYVNSEDAIEVKRETQSSPLHSQNINANTTYTTGDFASAYIEHGVGPTDKTYEFVVKPNTDAAEMTAFSAAMQSNPPYEVLFHTENAHVVRNTTNDTESYVLFEQNVQLPNCVVKTSDRQTVLHVQPDGNNLKIAVGDIDKDYGGLKGADTTTVFKITLRGKWKIGEGDDGLSISELTDTTTVLRVAAIEGRAYDATLLPEPANGMLQLLPSPETETALLILPFSNETYQIELKDENGVILFDEMMSMGEQTLDTSTLPVGIYNVCMDGQAKFILELNR